jgi:NADP-dependent 3-hydroxy acid dehydrogenase YdfG
MRITGKVALVTGSGQGIGRAIALRLASDGADVAIVDVTDGKMKAVADEVRGTGRKATIFKADVSKRDDVYAAIDHAEKELGGFDIMINNAGIAQVQPLSDVTPEEVEKILKVNVEGVLWGIQAAAKKFKERKQKGKIISASSIAGHDGFEMLGVYSATKFAVRALTQAAAKEFAQFFGRDFLMTSFPARLAIKYHCPIVPIDMERLPGHKFHMIFGTPIFPPANANSQTEQQMTQAIAEQFERTISRSPETWFCNKRRWLD